MPGPCQRIRLPSLVTVIRSPKPDCSPVRRKEQHRVVMMGSARVGKSSIISQFLYDKYLSRYRQTVEELHRGEYELDDGSALTLDILDTSGAFQFPAMRALSISTGGAFILVFAVDEEESWKEVERLRNQVRVLSRSIHILIARHGDEGVNRNSLLFYLPPPTRGFLIYHQSIKDLLSLSPSLWTRSDYRGSRPSRGNCYCSK